MKLTITHDRKGISILELILTILIISICAGIFLRWQSFSWFRTTSLNRITTAGQVIEKQIEYQRLQIGIDPENNYPKFKNRTDTTIVDNTVKPPITVKWKIAPAKDRNNNNLDNVRLVTLTAKWSNNPGDTLQVITCIAKNF
jgi:type II secretory pathway pseudopilin PulG